MSSVIKNLNVALSYNNLVLCNILWFLNFKIKYEKLMQYHSVLIGLLFPLSFSLLKFHCLHIRGRTAFDIDVHFSLFFKLSYYFLLFMLEKFVWFS